MNGQRAAQDDVEIPDSVLRGSARYPRCPLYVSRVLVGLAIDVLVATVIKRLFSDPAPPLLLAADPERLYVIKDGVLVYVGGKGPFGYITRELEKALLELEEQQP
jgi:hypothetical protein